MISQSLQLLKQSLPASITRKINGVFALDKAVEVPTSQWFSDYVPAYLSHVNQVYTDDTADLSIRIYLPEKNEGASNSASSSDPPLLRLVELKVDDEWVSLNPPHADQACWSLELKRIPIGTPLIFRYKDLTDLKHDWACISPLNDLENVYGSTYVPNVSYAWKHDPPQYGHAKVLMETTLEGLIAGYKGGKFAPKDISQLFQNSISQRILSTDIPGCLAEWNIDEIMVPVCASVANRAHLDPKFNYLTYNFVEIDWQVGDTVSFKRLVDKFYAYKIQIVPDLIFAHQVRRPFQSQLSMDQMVGLGDAHQVFEDLEAFLFRDYGTWMLNLTLPNVRKMLIEKVITFIKKYHLKVIRIDYIDGLILQYSNRQQNYAEQFIRELRAELNQWCPEVVTLGETFEVAGNPAVKEFINVFYAPIGFSIVEELYKPPGKMVRPLYPSVDVLAIHIEQVLQSDRREAFYAQLHDETWYCPHIIQGRPYVPWAYGGNPAELAKHQGEDLVQMNLLEPKELLNFIRRTVRNAEALTMFLANLRYMFVPSVDSLSLGCLDEPDQWRVTWEGVSPAHLKEWQNYGLSKPEILNLHDQHRADMIELRHIFREYTKVDESSYQPLVHPQVNHFDENASLLSIFRPNHHHLRECLLVLFNFGPQAFCDSLLYELPVPEGFAGKWGVLFDGDRRSLGQRIGEKQVRSYAKGTILETTDGEYSNRSNVLRLTIGSRSLIVLNYQVDN